MTIAFAYKLAILLVGFFIVRMGFTLLLKGISGQFRFKAELKGVKADLVSAAPGIFFVFAGGALVIFAVIGGLHFDFANTTGTPQTSAPTVKLPDSPP